ncbi:MAG: hypothetical protein FWG38_08775, partial [Defluviitaleaceae bacterium]|nr:hypothetical protein [Defluviitaleaceae bacterium]
NAEAEDFHVIPEAGGQRLYTPQRRHCAPIGSETFPKLEPYAFQEGILTFGNFGDATTRLMRAKPLRTMTARFLKENPRYLLSY